MRSRTMLHKTTRVGNPDSGNQPQGTTIWQGEAQRAANVSRIEVPFKAPSSHQLMSVASIVPEAYPTDGPTTEADRAAATGLIGDLLGDYLEYPASHFPGVNGEFVLVFPDISKTDAGSVLERARRAVRNRPDVPDVMVSFSAGLASNEVAEDQQRTLDTGRELRSDAQVKGGDRVQIQTEENSEQPTILLAEDDTLTARLIVHRLQREGHIVVHHPDDQSALEAAQEAGAGAYALAILDMKIREWTVSNSRDE